MSEPFDLEQVYDEQIFPLMAQILAICKAHDLPMLATFVYAQREENGEPRADLCTSLVNPKGRLHKATDNTIQAASQLIRQGFVAWSWRVAP